MVDIDLVNFSPNGIILNRIDFSDSQTLIKIGNPECIHGEHVRIISRGSWNDIQNIIQTVKLVRELKAESITLYMPYLLGARSDRKFDDISINYLKNVIAPILNSLELYEIIVNDVHSIAAENCINNLVNRSYLNTLAVSTQSYGENFVLISPDEGATKRTSEVGKSLGLGGTSIVNCIKRRNVLTGEIIDVNVLTDDLSGKRCVVIDDICDGGATFIELAKALKAKNAGELTLIVSHGIFSKGVSRLLQDYNLIITTNSIKELTDEERKSERVIRQNVF